ncbi:MAG TPA: transcriptional regulator [Bacteroidales bacterium]|nr:transcriptional regulator [Bacteroidales bacterium]HNR40960.1 transcriptional regulator [Bacteroidales bacterium]HPM19027.1 transcriptional regulator [Bacteroidales bacterium]
MRTFRELDPVIHSQFRLAVISLLIGVEVAEFTWLREQTEATAGNLSVQISKLKEAGYIDVVKKFSNNYQQILCRITPPGRNKFAEYGEALKDYLNP